ncbi:hypothetical protein PVK06_025082 [Gossypium arboreum]|uniref:Uncharacterized protein n=1 Tax=Gossypium arboreum TaxID=29729 RepID=A0ABR0PFL9_GOSAR|nr:hypothetical protein PVK06_025082 [Gossypium arboreum]
MNRRGRYGNDWGKVHKEYITMWNNRLGRVPQMDRAFDLQPSLEYIQWYCEIGKPFLFGGRSMAKLEAETELHSGDSSYHSDLGGDDDFLGSSGYVYNSEFDIFSPLPPQYSSHPGSYPLQYSASSGSYPLQYSDLFDPYLSSYSTSPGLYPP